MKKLSILLCMLVPCLLAQAQTQDRKWNVGVFGGTTEYAGDLGNGFLDFSKSALQNNWIAGLSLSRYLNRSFDLSLTGSYGTWGYYKTERTFKADMQTGYVSFKFKFANGYIIEEDSWIAPYLLVGAGFTRTKGDRTTGGIDYPAIAGAGINFRVSDMIGIYYQGTYGYLNSDVRDNADGGSLNDAFLYHTIGLNFNIGKQKDEDKDGVSDKKDKCPGTPLKAKVDADGCPIDSDKDGVADYMDECPDNAGTTATKGCPDSDKDGVADKDDQCPSEAGLVEMRGCPDADHDSIIDSKDKCPNVAGTLALDGCPDKDGDGIKDEEDKCPDVAGVALFGGCPDTDNDSIPDMKDACPNKKGPLATNGCPDTDNDGVHDGIDKCPTIAGPASNAGCPEVKREVKQLFQKALQGIQFETGKATLKPVSFPLLDAIVKVMNENPSYKLIIGGHTDDVGDDNFNMTLSQNRADAVANYLISKGVDPMRVSATGYGESRPVASNKTKTGKAKNRRVELSVEYIETTTIKQ